MTPSSEKTFGQVEAAIAAWNTKVSGAYEELTESLKITRRKLEVVQRILGARRTLSPTLVAARMKLEALEQNPEERMAAIQATLSRLNLLEQTLTSFHVELRTLHAQAGRAVAAGDILAEELLTLQDVKDAAALILQGEVQGLPGEATSEPLSDNDDTEALLRTENQRLRDQVARLTNETQQLRAKQAGAELRDTELEALRAELVHVREQLEHALQQGKGGETPPATALEQHSLKEAEMEALRTELGHVRQELQQARLQAETAQHAVGEREQKLTARVETLRRELLRAKEKLVHTQQRAQQTVLSAAHQQDLANLRTQVDAAQLDAVDATRLPGEDANARFERICQHAVDSEGNRRPMGKILLDAGVLTQQQLETALREQQTAWNRHLGNILVELGFTTEDAIAETLAAQIRAPFVHLNEETVQPEAIAMISGVLAHHHSCVPLRVQEDRLLVAMTNPFDLIALEDLQLSAGRSISPVVAPADEILRALRRYYPQFVRV